MLIRVLSQGCAGGGFENLCDVADMLDGQSIGDGRFSLSVYPASQPVYMELIRNGSIAKIMETGATVRNSILWTMLWCR